MNEAALFRLKTLAIYNPADPLPLSTLTTYERLVQPMPTDDPLLVFKILFYLNQLEALSCILRYKHMDSRT